MSCAVRFEVCGLTRSLPSPRTHHQALELLKLQAQSQPVVLQTHLSRGEQFLTWRGEVTAANAQQVWTATEGYICNRAGCQAELVVDLTELRFLDSTGVGLMVRAKKCAVRSNAILKFAGAQAPVQNVIRLSRLEAFLLGTGP